ncbi:unnamed protein product, partial [Prorocentrum cordatum]
MFACGCDSNWASRLRCGDCGGRCSSKVEGAARKANKAKLDALSDLKAELKMLTGGEQAASCVDVVEAKCAEPPKPKSITVLRGQMKKKLEGQHQKAVCEVQELEDQRARLDKHTSDAKEYVAELEAKLESADAEIESRHAAGVLGDGLKGLAKVFEQFKATAVDDQAVHQGLSQLQEVVKKDQENVDTAAAPEAPAGVPAGGNGGDGAARGRSTPRSSVFDSHWVCTINANTEKGDRSFLEWLDGAQALHGEGPAQRPAADIAVVQETRIREGDREGVQRRHRKRGFDFDVAAGLSNGEGPQAVSGGVGVRQQFAVFTLATKCIQPRRVHNQMVHLGDRLAIDLASAHLRDGEGMGEVSGDILWDLAARLRVAPRAGSLAELDFAVIADELQPCVFSHGPVPGAPSARAVQFSLSPEAAMKQWLRHAAANLLPLFDLHGEGAKKFSGRAGGVRFAEAQLADATRRRRAQLSSRAAHARCDLGSLLQRADLLAARGGDSHSLHGLRSRLGAISIPDYDGNEAPLSRCEPAIAASSGDAGLRRPEPLPKAALVGADDDGGLAPPVNGDEAVEYCLKEWLPLLCDSRRRGGLEEAASWGAPAPLPNLEVGDFSFSLKRHAWEGAPTAYLGWPSAIVSRAKRGGGRGPIALTCLQLRLWSAMRGSIVRRWGAQHREAWYIGGELNTCERAGWAHQILTAPAYEKKHSAGTALDDLRKFYENFSNKELFFEAQATGFPARLLKARCVLHSGCRAITVDGACSAHLRATGTALAGSSCATVIAKLLLYMSFKKATALYPSARLGSVVGDFALQTVGATGRVKAVLGPAARTLLACFDEKRAPVHFGKLSYLTPDADAANKLEAEWPPTDGRADRGRLLGKDVRDGRWRSTAIAAQRVDGAPACSRRLQVPRSAGAKVATVQRGGPTAAATWSSATTGLAPSVLRGLRVAAVRGEGPFAAGASVGLRLRCFPKGIERGPAVVNAGQVLQHLGMALWIGCPAVHALSALLDKARERRVQLGWTIADSRTVTTDLGLGFDLASVPPTFSKELAEESAKRWSGRDATNKLYPRQSSRLFLDALRRPEKAKESGGWGRRRRAALHPVISGTAEFRRAEASLELLLHAE